MHKSGTIILALIILTFVSVGVYGYAQLSQNNSVEEVACTADAKICPDGSAVGRQGPNCEFAECLIYDFDEVSVQDNKLEKHKSVMGTVGEGGIYYAKYEGVLENSLRERGTVLHEYTGSELGSQKNVEVAYLAPGSKNSIIVVQDTLYYPEETGVSVFNVFSGEEEFLPVTEDKFVWRLFADTTGILLAVTLDDFYCVDTYDECSMNVYKLNDENDFVLEISGISGSRLVDWKKDEIFITSENYADGGCAWVNYYVYSFVTREIIETFRNEACIDKSHEVFEKENKAFLEKYAVEYLASSDGIRISDNEIIPYDFKSFNLNPNLHLSRFYFSNR